MTPWSRRQGGSELLDAPGHSRGELRTSLKAVTRVNRWFGGLGALRSHLQGHRASMGEVSILDVGTGDGQVLDDLIRWGRKSGGRWTGVGVDRHPLTASIAGENLAASRRLNVVQADALALPFADRSFDVVTATLTLHHLDPDEVVKAVAEMARVARRLVLVNDLHRHPVNYALARLLSWTLWRGDRLTRHDGPLSVLRAFTPQELLQAGRDAGLGDPVVRRHLPYRLVLEGHP